MIVDGLLFGLVGMCERSARDLAEHADLTPATVTQMLEGLEAQGLVTRIRSDHDRREEDRRNNPRGGRQTDGEVRRDQGAGCQGRT